jgi:hypothetical protein
MPSQRPDRSEASEYYFHYIDQVPPGDICGILRGQRDSSIAFFDGLPADAWDRRGVASDNPFSVRALAWLTAGHAAHHTRSFASAICRR